MSESVKETKEILVGSIMIGKLISAQLKDGFQLQDLIAVVSDIMGNDEKKAKLQAAVADAQKSVAELKDISFVEGFELLTAALDELKS